MQAAGSMGRKGVGESFVRRCIAERAHLQMAAESFKDLWRHAVEGKIAWTSEKRRPCILACILSNRVLSGFDITYASHGKPCKYVPTGGGAWLAQVLLQFLDACMLKQRLPDAAFSKFEQLSSKQLEGLHKLIKELQVHPSPANPPFPPPLPRCTPIPSQLRSAP